MVKEKYYVTTPIYYPNDVPHLGHAYTTIAADILARWHKLLGKDVFFLTGTDEHGKKLADTAKKAGKEPKEFIDALIPEFKSAWKSLNIEYDRFIRTTDPDHESVVQEILQKCFDNEDIYLGEYEGLYCTACEAYHTEKTSDNGNCPIHQRPLEKLKEESYFFKLSKYQDFLLDLYEKNPDFISPKSRKNEVIARVKEELRDFSISRTSFDWGVPLPFDKKHVSYVWFDALLNYYSATKQKGKEKFWPAQTHIIGKDILWFHTVYWPAMLKSACLPLPEKVFAHGWWTVNDQKMGKSAGNAIKVDQLVSLAGADSARYFLFRSTPFGDEGDFSNQALIDRHNNELADKLGNLVSRVSTLAEKYGLEETPSALDSKSLLKSVEKHLDSLAFDKALNEIFAFLDKTNAYIQDKKPWTTKDPKVLYELANAIKDATILLSPFIPETAQKIAKTFNFSISLEDLNSPLKVSKIKKAPILFTKIDAPQREPEKPKTNKQKIPGVTMKDEITFDEFQKLDLRVAEIKAAEEIEGKDKLLKLSLSLGSEGERTIVAGIKPYYPADQLPGKKIIIVANLAPRKLGGSVSEGMLLAAGSKETNQCILLTVDKDVEAGASIS